MLIGIELVYLGEVLKRLSGQAFTMEYKYDGERAQGKSEVKVNYWHQILHPSSIYSAFTRRWIGQNIFQKQRR